MIKELMDAAKLAAGHSSVPPEYRQTIRISLTTDGLLVEGRYRTKVGQFDHEHHIGWRELDGNPRLAEMGVRCTIREMDARAFQKGEEPVRPVPMAVIS